LLLEIDLVSLLKYPYLLLAALLFALSSPLCQADVFLSHDYRVEITPLKGVATKQPIYLPVYLYVTDMEGDQILRFDAWTGAFVDHFVQEPSGTLKPSRVAFGPDGDMYVSSFYRGGRILRYDGAKGLYDGVFFNNTRYLDEPVTLIFRGNAAWALSNDIGQVVEIGANTGSVQDYWGSYVMSYPHDMVLDPWGNMLITNENVPDDGMRPVQVWSTRTGSFLTSVGPEDVGIATAIEFGPNGNFYVADWSNNRILRFDGRTYSYWGVFVDDVSRPSDIAFGPKGNLWVISDDEVVRFDGKTGDRLDTIIPAGSQGMIKPVALTFHTPGLLRRPLWNLWPEETDDEAVD
jgi:streptogramin lyase